MKLRNILLLMVVGLFVSCMGDNNTMPKPQTYFRMDISMPNYTKFSKETYPFSFEIPDYSKFEPVKTRLDSKNWFNLNFSKYGCKLYVSYKSIQSDTTLAYLINDNYKFVTEHNRVSSGVVEREYTNRDNKVYGVVFEIKGRDVASPYQFFITDSNKHFIRGALHFDFKANNDSLSPVIERVTKDLDHMISTFKWR